MLGAPLRALRIRSPRLTRLAVVLAIICGAGVLFYASSAPWPALSRYCFYTDTRAERYLVEPSADFCADIERKVWARASGALAQEHQGWKLWNVAALDDAAFGRVAATWKIYIDEMMLHYHLTVARHVGRILGFAVAAAVGVWLSMRVVDWIFDAPA